VSGGATCPLGLGRAPGALLRGFLKALLGRCLGAVNATRPSTPKRGKGADRVLIIPRFQAHDCLVHSTQLRVKEVGVERVVKVPEPRHGIRRRMGVPSAIVVSRSAKLRGWVMFLLWCGTLRRQSACTGKGIVVGVVVVGLDCEENKNCRGLGRSDSRLSSINVQLDRLAATTTEEPVNHRALPLNFPIYGCYFGRVNGVASLQKGAVNARLGRVLAPRPSYGGTTANPSAHPSAAAA